MSFDPARAEALRQSIDQTTQAILKFIHSGVAAAQATKLFQAHLEKLQEAQLALLTDASDDEGDTSVNLEQGPLFDSALTAFKNLQRAAAALSGNNTGASTPWYPDDSGEWIEVPEDCKVCPCESSLKIEVLLLDERIDRQWDSSEHPADYFAWDLAAQEASRIVAYKVVE